jgi:arginine deiminase
LKIHGDFISFANTIPPAMQKVFVPSEISSLKRVIVHSPDDGIARISPKRSAELLFDDIVYLPQMRREHDIFVDVLNAFIGADNVLHAQDLIFEAMEYSPEGRDEMLDMITQFEELPRSFSDEMRALPNKELAGVLISGYMRANDTILFDPIPNFIFTRDLAVAAKDARFRENLLTRFIFWSHPIFKKLKDEERIINLNMVDTFPPSRKGEQVSIEGGDVMILNEDYLLVGCSERSTQHGFHSLKNALFEKHTIDHVVMIQIPTDRSYMHVDTVFTQIHQDHCVAHKPIVVDGLSSYVVVHARTGTERTYSSIREFVLAEINANMEFIHGGGGQSPYQEREQWTDACNLLTLKPGVALAYDRNTHTEQALRSYGYAILPANELLETFRSDPAGVESIENTIITLPSAELARARGGSHCMSCPITRAQ